MCYNAFVRDFKRDFGPRDDRPKTMFKAICSDCGKECEVPFKPNGSKPVFCRDCFASKRRFEGPRNENFPPRRPNFEDRGPRQGPPPPPPHREFEQLNAKLDRILNLLTVQPEVKEVTVNEPEKVVEVKAPKTKAVKKKKASKE